MFGGFGGAPNRGGQSFLAIRVVKAMRAHTFLSWITMGFYFKMLLHRIFAYDDDEVLMHAGRLRPKAEGG